MARAAKKIISPSEDMDWINPDYEGLFQERLDRIERIRAAGPEALAELKAYYRDHPADFINDWGVTFDPRNADIDRPSLIPFILTPKQREWIDWVMTRWKTRTPGVNEKSRDMGVTWLAVALSSTLCLFRTGVVIGFGSRKAEYVDEIGTLKPILPKARMFMRHLPEEFRGDWEEWRDAPLMRVNFPTGSLITGEAGDQIGRGDRTSIYFVDEAAHLPRPQLVEAALSQTTNCRIDMSSVNGMGNPFAQKRWGGKVDVFIFDWHDDPRKDQAWYDKQVADLDPVVVAQEIDRDYSASVEGIVIPGAWVRSAIDAAERLKIPVTGKNTLALDVGDEGADKNAVAAGCGIEISHVDEWSGKGSDLFDTALKTFVLCDTLGIDGFRYDADGLGAGIRGDARVINETRQRNGQRVLIVEGVRGSDAVFDPEGIVDQTLENSHDKGRLNKDFFANAKAQNWWHLRRLFMNTHRWVTLGKQCNPDEIISLNSKTIPPQILLRLVAELSQVTRTFNNVGKMLINKKPKGTKSPNLADAVVIKRALIAPPPIDYTGVLAQIRSAPRRRRGY